MLSILYYLFKNAIALTIGAGIVMLLQKTILKRSCSIVKTLWIILIVSAFFPFEIFNLKVKTQTDNLGASVAQSTGTGYGLYGYIFNILFVVWAVVAVAIFVYKLAKHKSLKCDLKNLTHFKNNIYLCKAD